MLGYPRLASPVTAAALGALLAGCAASTDLVKSCCYQGDASLAHLDQLRLNLENGTTVAFRDIFSGLSVEGTAFGRTFPFDKADIARVTFASLLDVLPRYDANEDGFIEEPELTTLYIHEAARGLGHAVASIDAGAGDGAIITSRAEVSGLVVFVEQRADEMAEPQRAIFRDLDWLGHEIETQPDFGDSDTGTFTP